MRTTIILIASLVALLAISAVCPAVANAQHAIGSGTIDFTGYEGGGLNPSPGATQLDSDTWKVKGCSDGSTSFGDTQEGAGDFARGTSTGGVSTGGLYGFDTDGAGDDAFGWQPTGSDFAGNLAGGGAGTEGEFVLKLVNNTGNTITSLQVNFDVKCNNNGDNDRVNVIEFAWSPNDATYTTEAAGGFSSPATTDANGFVTTAKSVTITGISIADAANFFLRWKTYDSSGSGCATSWRSTILPSPRRSR